MIRLLVAFGNPVVVWDVVDTVLPKVGNVWRDVDRIGSL